jgi:hypothetical protein
LEQSLWVNIEHMQRMKQEEKIGFFALFNDVVS